LNELLDGFVNVFGYEFRTLPVDAKRDAVLGYLRDLGTASLIVVDNAETITDPAVFRFLEGIPRPSAALVTTREALEREGLHIDIYQMEPFEATRLFVVEARRRKSGWVAHLTPSDLKAMEDISRHLDGHPLAIKLAAAMVGSDSLAVIRQRVLAAPHKEVSTRFDFSYYTLDENEKELLHRMAAFASSATEEVIKLACTHPDFTGDDALPQWRDDLTELVRKSFVDTIELSAFDDSGNEIKLFRYRLHPLMRQYAAGKAGLEAMKNHRRRAANLFLAYATMFEDDYNALQAEHENILAGMDWAYAEDEWEMVRSFVWATGVYLSTRGYWIEEKVRLKEGTKACEELRDKAGVAISLHHLGMLAQATGDITEARRLYGESLKIAQELGDKSGVARSLHNLGALAQNTGDIGEAHRLYGESLKIAQELGDKSGVARSLHQLGILAQDEGDIGEARRLYGESLKIAQELGDKSGVAITLAQSSLLEEKEGNLGQALDLIRAAEKLFLELGSPTADQARRVRERLELKAQEKPSSSGRFKRWLGLG
jgi:tetratricopeptide (TPR) repeat protein